MGWYACVNSTDLFQSFQAMDLLVSSTNLCALSIVRSLDFVEKAGADGQKPMRILNWKSMEQPALILLRAWAFKIQTLHATRWTNVHQIITLGLAVYERHQLPEKKISHSAIYSLHLYRRIYSTSLLVQENVTGYTDIFLENPEFSISTNQIELVSIGSVKSSSMIRYEATLYFSWGIYKPHSNLTSQFYRSVWTE
jgi:hypothetical protein